ncbi:MAG TPA: cytochrome c maturation protein CcmE [Acidimicrobiia bacterium]|nr:cytochrome c maturation protein CcmE [Acidimicrobiia bacterium]
MKRYRMFLISMLGLLAILVGFLISNIRENLVYYRTPTEVVDDPPAADAGRFRLGGLVVAGTVVESSTNVTFAVTDGTTTVEVDHVGTPQQLFGEGIGVVLEGTWDGSVFHSDSMIIKHDEQYRTEEGGVYTPDSRYPAP